MAKNTFLMRLRGVVATGKGEARRFTSLGWVREQFRGKLKIEPYPGTLNLRIIPEDLLKLVDLKMLAGVSIESADKAFCAARGYPVKVGGRVYGAIIFPDVAGYPADQIEIVSAGSIREELGLKDGDIVEIEAQAAIPGR